MKFFKKHNSKIKALFYPIWKNYGILRAKPPITKWNMLITQIEMIFIEWIFINFIEKLLFHFIGENLWPTVAYLARMQLPKNTGFYKGKLNVMAFLNNLLVT